MNHADARNLLYNRVSLAVLFLLYCAFSLFSAWMVYNGLHLSGNFSAMWSWALELFTLILQFVVITSMLCVPDMFAHKSWFKRSAALFISIIICAIVLFEIFHGMISQINAGQGEDMRTVEMQALQTLNDRNTTLSEQISAVFTTRRREFETQREQAILGHDSSGVRKFGEIARTYQRHFDNTSNYMDLENTIAKPINSDNPRILFNDVNARFKQCTAQLQRLVQFENSIAKLNALLSADNAKIRLETANIQALVPAGITTEHAALEQDIQRKQSDFKVMRQITATELAMQEAFTLLNKIRQFEPINGHSVLAIVYSVTPFLCTVVLSLLIRFVNEQLHRNDDLELIKDEIAYQREKDKLYQELSGAKMNAATAEFVAKSSKKIFDISQEDV